MLVTRKSVLTGLIRTLELDVTQAELDEHANGEYAQVVWQRLSPDDREFLISGITPSEWELAFPPEDEEIDTTDQEGLTYDKED